MPFNCSEKANVEKEDNCRHDDIHSIGIHTHGVFMTLHSKSIGNNMELPPPPFAAITPSTRFVEYVRVQFL